MCLYLYVVIFCSLLCFAVCIPLSKQAHSIVLTYFRRKGKLTTMHAFDVDFKFLRLTKLSPTEITQRSRALGVRCTAIRAMHLQVIKTQEELRRQKENYSLWYHNRYTVQH